MSDLAQAIENLDWQPAATAPKDGTEVWLRNSCMDHAVVGRWGSWYFAFTDKAYDHFGVTQDPLCCAGSSMARGSRIVPDEWAPFDPSFSTRLTAEKSSS